MTIFASTGRRRELGAELRRIREGRGYTGQEMAERMSWTPTMLSRAETGKRTMSTIEIATYTGVCGVTGKEQDELLALAGERDDYRLKRHAGRVPDALRALIFQETTASGIEGFESIYLPGIAQTPEYARALFEMGGLYDEAGVDRLVEIRMSRREVLTRFNPAQCTFYVHEHALRSMVGSPQVMAEQMLHLVFATSRPQFVIRVIPASAGARGQSLSTFQIFHYPEDSPVIYVQNETTCEFLEDSQDLLAYQALLNRLATVSLDDAHSRAFVAAMASEYEQGAAQHGRSPGLAQE
jgi:transcriptional regulator with XRE-family HTH domain